MKSYHRFPQMDFLRKLINILKPTYLSIKKDLQNVNLIYKVTQVLMNLMKVKIRANLLKNKNLTK